MVGQTAGYVRVSTLEQNPDRQLEALGRTDRIFEDRASGSSTERPALQDLLAWVREGDTVKVHSMDRLARSVVDLHKVVDRLVDRGATVEFLKEGHRFSKTDQDPVARLMLGVMGAVAEFERSLIRERQAEGIAAAKARGVYRGRKRALSPKDIQEARLRIDDGIPKARVARDLGISRQTLYAALSQGIGDDPERAG